MNNNEIKYTFTYEKDPIRVDKYLVEAFPNKSRTELRNYFDEKKVFVNGKNVKPSFIIKATDEIIIFEREKTVLDVKQEDIELDIVYEDHDVIVVNKPSGMVVHPAFGHYSGTLVNALMHHCNDLSTINGVVRAGIVHRIDKDTSGLIVACKNDQAHRSLSEQLHNKTATRKYIAIVCGNINHNLGKIDAPIGRDPLNRQKMAVISGGKNAITHFKVLERFKDYTLIELKLETGRTHQIRVHMAYIGFPVLGDPLYGNKKRIDANGQFLHAKTLGFVHPKTGEYMEFDSELPNYFMDEIEILRKTSFN